jgi:hypothetical protein
MGKDAIWVSTDDTVGTGYAQGYLWVVPGNAAGKLVLKGIEGAQQPSSTLQVSVINNDCPPNSFERSTHSPT